MKNDEPTITGSGTKRGYEVTLIFEQHKGEFWLPDVITDAPNDFVKQWKREIFDMSVDTNLYSVAPRIPPFGSVERVETIIFRFFGVDDEGNSRAKIQYTNCEPTPDYSDEDEDDLIY